MSENLEAGGAEAFWVCSMLGDLDWSCYWFGSFCLLQEIFPYLASLPLSDGLLCTAVRSIQTLEYEVSHVICIRYIINYVGPFIVA